MTRFSLAVVLLLTLSALWVFYDAFLRWRLPTTEPAAGDFREAAERGQYLFRAAGCAGCHTDEPHDGAYLAGGRAFETRFGVFFSPNITPDPETGIGEWRESDMMRALRHGVSPDGSHYYPVFPFTAYTRLSDRDILAIFAYLRTVPPVRQQNREHELSWFVHPRFANWGWKRLFFEAGPRAAAPDIGGQLQRGEYLVNALGHCGECHSPRNKFGALDSGMYLAGTRDGPEGEVVPNITPDRETGIGNWSEDDLSYFLETGGTPDGDFTGSLMAEVVDNGLRYLNKDDRAAMVGYLRSVRAIRNQVKPVKSGLGKQKDEYW